MAIAVALANTPQILLADEPTAELDSESAANVLDAFRAVNHEFGVTIVMVTHDLAAARRADRRIRVRDGRLLREGTAVDPIGPDGRVRLPDEVVAALGGADLRPSCPRASSRLRRRSETGHAWPLRTRRARPSATAARTACWPCAGHAGGVAP